MGIFSNKNLINRVQKEALPARDPSRLQEAMERAVAANQEMERENPPATPKLPSEAAREQIVEQRGIVALDLDNVNSQIAHLTKLAGSLETVLEACDAAIATFDAKLFNAATDEMVEAFGDAIKLDPVEPEMAKKPSARKR